MQSFEIAGKGAYGSKPDIFGICWDKQQKFPPITAVAAASVMLPGPGSAHVTYAFPKRGVIDWRGGRPTPGGLPLTSGNIRYNPQTLRITSGIQRTGRYRLFYTVNYATVRPEPKIPPTNELCQRSTTP